MAPRKSRPIGRTERPSARKHPNIVENPAGFLEQMPRWSVAHLTLDGPFGWGAMSPEDFRLVLSYMQSLEKRTWNEILKHDGGKNHAISVDLISSQARAELARLQLDDFSEVISLRVTGSKRIFGIQTGSILQLLWWDPAHGVCPARKKHT